MSKAKDPTLEDDSEQDWEKIFSPGGLHDVYISLPADCKSKNPLFETPP